MPTARISPGTAYPIDRKKLNLFTNAPGLYLIEKFMSRAKVAQSKPAEIARDNVLIDVDRNFLVKNSKLLWYDQKANSKTGKIKPINTGRKQRTKAKEALDPYNF